MAMTAIDKSDRAMETHTRALLPPFSSRLSVSLSPDVSASVCVASAVSGVRLALRGGAVAFCGLNLCPAVAPAPGLVPLPDAGRQRRCASGAVRRLRRVENLGYALCGLVPCLDPLQPCREQFIQKPLRADCRAVLLVALRRGRLRQRRVRLFPLLLHRLFWRGAARG